MSIKIAFKPSARHRFPELDIWRGLAVVGMVTLHAAYVGQVVLFDSFVIGADSLIMTILVLIGRMSAISFLLLVGVSGYISACRKKLRSKKIGRSFFVRAAMLYGWATAISLLTWIFIPEYYVRFGILHLIAVGVLCLPVFLHVITRRLGVVLILAVWIYISFAADQLPRSELLLPLGVIPSSFSTVDYWPLIPWLVAIIFGVELGNYLYPNCARNRGLSTQLDRLSHIVASSPAPRLWHGAMRSFSWIGQYALAIYLVHVPVLALLFLLIESVAQALSK